MSSTILRELRRVNRVITVRIHDEWCSADYNRAMIIQEAGLRPRELAGRRIDAVAVFKGIRPYERHCEAMEREDEARRAAGGRELCPDCGERTLVSQDVKTLGVRGRSHPGDEYSVYRTCENCDYKEL